MLKQKFIKYFVLFTLTALILTSFNAKAAIKTTRLAGPWTTASNWEGGVLPASTDDVVIKHFMTLGSDATCASLSIQNGGRLTISAGTRTTVTGALALGGSGIEMLTTSSEASSLIFNSISGLGNLYFGRYVSGTSGGTKNWHIVSSPVTTLSIPGFLSNAYGIVETNNDESLYAFASYNESINKWNYYSTTDGGTWSGLFNPGQGYTIAMVSSGQITINGRPATGDVSVNIARTFISGAQPPTGGWGWNAIGNPYTASLSTSQFYISNRSMLDPVYGGLYIWNPSSQSYDIITQSTAGYIQMGQGFVVRSKEGGGSIGFTYGMRAHSPSTPYKSGNLSDPPADPPSAEFTSTVKLHAVSGDIRRNTTFVFSPRMTTGLDPYFDAGLLPSGGGMDIYSKLLNGPNDNFGLQALPSEGFTKLSIPVYVNLDKTGLVEFSAELMNIPDGFDVILEDRIKNTETRLNTDKYSTEISVNTGTTNRFYIHFIKSSTTKTVNTLKNDIQIFSRNKELNISGESTFGAKVDLYNITGSLAARYQLENSSYHNISCVAQREGIYILKIETSDKQIFTEKIYLK